MLLKLQMILTLVMREKILRSRAMKKTLKNVEMLMLTAISMLMILKMMEIHLVELMRNHS